MTKTETLRQIEDLTGALPNDDHARFVRFSPELLAQVLALVERAHEKGKKGDCEYVCEDCGYDSDKGE